MHLYSSFEGCLESRDIFLRRYLVVNIFSGIVLVSYSVFNSALCTTRFLCLRSLAASSLVTLNCKGDLNCLLY